MPSFFHCWRNASNVTNIENPRMEAQPRVLCTVTQRMSLPTWNTHLPLKFPIFLYDFNQIRNFLTPSCRIAQYQMSLKSVQWETRWWKRPDRWPDKTKIRHISLAMKTRLFFFFLKKEEQDWCKRSQDVRKSRLRTVKKPIEKHLELKGRQIWYIEYFHTQARKFCGQFGQDGELRVPAIHTVSPHQRFIFVICALRNEHAWRSPLNALKWLTPTPLGIRNKITFAIQWSVTKAGLIIYEIRKCRGTWYSDSSKITQCNYFASQQRQLITYYCWSQLPRGLRPGSVAARLLGLWVQIRPREWCVLLGRGLCDKPITHLEESCVNWKYQWGCHGPRWVGETQEKRETGQETQQDVHRRR